MDFAEIFDKIAYISSAHSISRAAYGKDGIKYKKFIQIIDEESDIVVKNVEKSKYVFTNYLEKLIIKDSNSLPRQISISS